MQAWKFLAIGFTVAILSGCAKPSFLKADCNSCTEEEQEWKTFSWNDLQGNWKGSVETLKNDRQKTKKSKQEKKVDIRFFTAAEFLRAQNLPACAGLPEQAFVMNGLLWERSEPIGAKEFEAFAKEDDKAIYGRVAMERVNGAGICRFMRLGRVMGKNRLSLPAAQFSENASTPGRTIASAEKKESEVNVEFLRFDALHAQAKAFRPDGRGPASVKEMERPPFIMRVFKINSVKAAKKDEWQSTEELFYRLWKQ